MFRFCIAHTEFDWREGTEQYKFIENCLASVDRQRQPWLIFLAHRVLGYSSAGFYVAEGSFEEPMGREDLEKLWQKYKVDIAVFGHVHNYERSCPVYEVLSNEQSCAIAYSRFFLLHFALHVLGTAKSECNQDSEVAITSPTISFFFFLQNICTRKEKNSYIGPLNGTIHVVAGGAGARLHRYAAVNTTWSIYKDYDYGFVKLTAFNHSSLLFEYKKSRDGKVYDSFTISRNYRDILTCSLDSCPPKTLPR